MTIATNIIVLLKFRLGRVTKEMLLSNKENNSGY